MYRREGGQWSLEQTLVGNESYYSFGRSVALYGSDNLGTYRAAINVKPRTSLGECA